MSDAVEQRGWRENEAAVFLVHAVAVLWPGARVPDFNAHPNEPTTIDQWIGEDAMLLIEEGRRQIDQQIADLDRIRSRAQFVFTSALAFLLVVFGTSRRTALAGIPTFTLWLLASAMTLLSMLGSASIMTSSSELSGIDAALLTQSEPPILLSVAAAYARSVRVGANATATRLTVYRDAAWCLVIASVVYGAAWLLVTL